MGPKKAVCLGCALQGGGFVEHTSMIRMIYAFFSAGALDAATRFQPPELRMVQPSFP